MKFTPLLAGAMSGSMGGVVASHNKGGAYLRRRSVPTDPGSSFQVTVRAAMGLLAQRWVNVLTPTQRMAWDLYAQQTSWVDTLGQTIQLSGINHYIRSNSPRVVAETYVIAHGNFDTLAILDDAPTVFDLGTTPTIVAEVVMHEQGPPVAIEVVFQLDPPQTGAHVFAYVSPGQNPSMMFWKGPYLMSESSVLGGSGIVGVGLSLAEAPYTIRYPLPVEDQTVYYAIRVQQTDGRLSELVRRGPLLVGPALP